MAEFAVVQQAARTGSTGTQDFTVSGFGTPKAALFFASFGTAAGTAVNHALLSVSMTDGVRSVFMAVRAEDASNPADASGFPDDTHAIAILSQTTNALDGVADFDSWITNGIRVNWTSVPPSGYLITCVLIGGNGVSNAYVGSVQPPGVLDTATDVTAPGFTPDVVLFISSVENFNGTADSNAKPSLGICVNDGSNTQRSMNWHHANTTIPSVLVAMLDTNCVARRAGAGSSGPEIQCQDFDASGFSVYNRVSVSTPTLELGYLAIKLNGLSAKLLTSASPIVPGDHTITGATFKPQFALMLHGSALVADTVYTDGNAEVCGISAFTAQAAGCSAIWAADNATPVDAESITNNIPVSLRKTAANFMTASFSAFTSDGVTLSYSTTDGSARQRAVLFVQSSNPVVGVDSGSYSLSGLATVLRNTATTWLRLRK